MTKKVETQQDPMELFMTGKRQSEAKRMYLYTPSGKITSHYLDVLGFHSKQVRAAKKQLMFQAAEKIKDGSFNEAFQEVMTLKLLASSIVGWSFEKECTEEAVLEFLEGAPAIAEAVDYFCSNDENYFEKK